PESDGGRSDWAGLHVNTNSASRAEECIGELRDLHFAANSRSFAPLRMTKYLRSTIISKTLLVVGGGIEAIPGLQKAKSLGLYVVVSDANPEAPGFRSADDCIIA